MSSPPISSPIALDLDSVIATSELNRRPSRQPDRKAESRLLLRLTRQLSQSPESFFPELANAAKELSRADSTGISLLNEEEKRFVWPAVSGKLDYYIGSGTPSDFGPCGTVLERQTPLLFIRPDRHFTYLAPITPPLEEVLLTPFFVNNKPVGTIWAVMHEKGRTFEAEDKRLLENLSKFAANAYSVLTSNGALESFLQMKPVNPI